MPFAYPRSPDTGPGLTDAGKELVKACNHKRIMLDLSHLNEAGFWDVARLSDAPLVATHSNAHALCQSSRNLTDRQLDAIKESDGMVGLNFAVSFLREDGRSAPDTPLATMVAHVRYLVDRLGVERVGLGSDFDGAAIPSRSATWRGCRSCWPPWPSTSPRTTCASWPTRTGFACCAGPGAHNRRLSSCRPCWGLRAQAPRPPGRGVRATMPPSLRRPYQKEIP